MLGTTKVRERTSRIEAPSTKMAHISPAEIHTVRRTPACIPRHQMLGLCRPFLRIDCRFQLARVKSSDSCSFTKLHPATRARSFDRFCDVQMRYFATRTVLWVQGSSSALPSISYWYRALKSGLQIGSGMKNQGNQRAQLPLGFPAAEFV